MSGRQSPARDNVLYYEVGGTTRDIMARQLTLQTHCLLCLTELDPERNNLGEGSFKWVYERQDPGFAKVAGICKQCLTYLRGGNWPTDVYAKLTGARRSTGEGQRAVEALIEA